MIHQTPQRITNSVEIYDECMLIWNHTAGHESGMKVSNKYVDADQFNNTNIHSTKFASLQRNNITTVLLFCTNVHRSGHNTWPLAVDYTVELSIYKWRNQDQYTLAYQNSMDTNKQSSTSTETLVAVPIDVWVWRQMERVEMRKTGNFLSIFRNISLGFIVNSVYTANAGGVRPIPAQFFKTDLINLDKWPLRTSKKRNSVIYRNTFTLEVAISDTLLGKNGKSTITFQLLSITTCSHNIIIKHVCMANKEI